MTDDVVYSLGFSHCLGIGPIKYSALIKRFKTVKKAYLAKNKEIIELLGLHFGQKFINFRIKFNPEKKLEELQKKNIQIICQEDKRFPLSLKNIPDPPICLYIKGDLKNFDLNEKNFFIAVVGTRGPTIYGQQIAKKFAFDLANTGVVIVSGLALGVDAIAHQAALDAGGKTVAFLGCGVDIVYPPSNHKLYQEIIKKGSLIISEFPPGQLVLRGLFVARNRLISGLSKGVLVIEGSDKSGALITARYAAEQGKEVFAPPAPITSEMSEAPIILLKQGARLVTSAEDIFEEFNLKVTPDRDIKLLQKLPKEEKEIYEVLTEETKTADELSVLLKEDIQKILKTISLLEIKRMVEKNSAGKYQLILH